MNKSHWLRTSTIPRFERLHRNIKVDVVVVGAGITGATAAYLLKKAGLKVALLERDRCTRVDSANTTAHLTCVTDARLSELVKSFGEDHARAVWEAGDAAIQRIHETVHAEDIDCQFQWVPGYLHASLLSDGDDERKGLAKDTELANGLGFQAELLDSVPLVERPGIRFAEQALFHPLRYISRLLVRIPGRNSYVFEHSAPSEITEEPLTVTVGYYKIQCKKLVVATHVPLMGIAGYATATLFQTKLTAYSTYAIGAKVPRGRYPRASFWDTSDPYYYLRIDPRKGHDYAILGGEDHKTGQRRSTDASFKRLAEIMKKLLPDAKLDAQWTGQVIESHDGLPLIGEITDNQFIGTAYAGNGMTFGTLAGMMACDYVLERRNPWSELFNPKRKAIRRGAWDYLKENLDYPYYLAKDRMRAAEGKSLRSVARGTGKILKVDGKKVAAYRDPKGVVTVLSPVCSHLGCLVQWNDGDSTWDCPCHGSRFKPTGEVIAGPAEEPLRMEEK